MKHFSTLLIACPLILGVMTSDLRAQATESDPPVGFLNLEFYSGAAMGLSSSRAVVALPGAIADSGEKKVLPNVGLGANFWFTRHIGGFIDFGAVDGGKATAQVGNMSSEVQSELASLHFGLQVQKPGPRFRPYLSIGAGPGWVRMNGSFIDGRSSITVHERATAGSYVYGGGFRYFISRRLGARVGLEGVTLHSRETGLNNTYTRVVFGILMQR